MKRFLKDSIRVIIFSREPWRTTISLLARLWYSWITEPCRMYAYLEKKPVPGEGINCDLCVHRGGWPRCSYSLTTPDPMAEEHLLSEETAALLARWGIKG